MGDANNTPAVAGHVGCAEKATRFVPLFVWGTWGIAFVTALAYVGSYGHGIPLWDDYALVPYLTGNEPVTARWLWEPWNGHRIPLLKLIMLGLLQLSGGDFRVGMYLNVLALGVLAFFMIWIPRGLRGYTSYADAFGPLLLLHWGYSEFFLSSFNFQFLSSTFLAGILLFLMVRNERLSPATGLVLATCLLLLTFCGLQGLLFVPPLALWLVYSEIRNWGSSSFGDKLCILAVLFLGVGTFLLLPLFLLHNEELGDTLVRPPFRAVVRTSLQFLSTGLGHKAKAFWPLPALGIAGFWLLSVILVVRAWWTRPAERIRAPGFLAFLMGFSLVALGIGCGRAVGWGYEAGFATRYGILIAMSLCCAFFAWELYSPPKIVPGIRLAFFFFVALCFAVNIMPGLRYGRGIDQGMVDFERDLYAQEPCYILAGRHARFLLPYGQAEFADCLLQLRQAGIGPFRYVQDNPPFTEIPLGVKPTVSSQGSDDGGGYFEFTLPKPRNVGGIQISLAKGSGTGVWSRLQAFWRRPDQSDFPGFPESPQATMWLPGTDQAEAATVWVGEAISSFRLRCDEEFSDSRIPRIVLLVPRSGGVGRGPGSVRRDAYSP